MYEIFIINTTVEPFHGTTTRGSGLMKELILEREKEVLNDTQKKQLSLCYYYRGLIEYNIQENLTEAENFMRLAIEKDPQINGPDLKSMLLKAEIKFKSNNPKAFDEFKNVSNCLTRMGILTDTQNRLLSRAYLGMATCKILDGGKKFLPMYYKSIGHLDDEVISEAIGWLKKSNNSHIYIYLTLGQLSFIFEKAKRNLGLEPSFNYFDKTYNLIKKTKLYESSHETREQILAYSVKLVCEKFLNESSLLENTKLILKDLLSVRDLKSVYSIFAKVNVSRSEYLQELKEFGIF